jgi:hypothetical protein
MQSGCRPKGHLLASFPPEGHLLANRLTPRTLYKPPTVIYNTMEFRHAYLQILAVLVDNKIINGIQVMAGGLQYTPPPTSSNQLDVIEMLRTLFEKWKLLAPPALQN